MTLSEAEIEEPAVDALKRQAKVKARARPEAAGLVLLRVDSQQEQMHLAA